MSEGINILDDNGDRDNNPGTKLWRPNPALRKFERFSVAWAQAFVDRAPNPNKTKFCPKDVRLESRRIKIQRQIGAGDNGRAFLAENKLTGDLLVLKFLYPQPNADGWPNPDAERANQLDFIRVDQPNAVRLIATFAAEGCCVNPEYLSSVAYYDDSDVEGTAEEEVLGPGDFQQPPAMTYTLPYPNLGVWADYGVQEVLFYDFCTAGDLLSLVWNFRKRGHAPVPEGFIWHVYEQLSKAVAYLHGYEDPYATTTASAEDAHVPDNSALLHCDIKLENVFLMWNPDDYSHLEYPDVRLGDFGACYFLDGSGKDHIASLGVQRNTCCQAIAPPEWCSRSIQSTKFDVWSIGCIIHSLCLDGKGPLKLEPKSQAVKDQDARYLDRERQKFATQWMTEHRDKLKKASGQTIIDLTLDDDEDAHNDDVQHATKRRKGPGRPPKLGKGKSKAAIPGLSSIFVRPEDIPYPKKLQRPLKSDHHELQWPDDYEVENYGHRNTVRAMHEIPLIYSQELREVLKWNLALKHSDRPDSYELYNRVVEVLDRKQSRREAMATPMPSWFVGQNFMDEENHEKMAVPMDTIHGANPTATAGPANTSPRPTGMRRQRSPGGHHDSGRHTQDGRVRFANKDLPTENTRPDQSTADASVPQPNTRRRSSGTSTLRTAAPRAGNSVRNAVPAMYLDIDDDNLTELSRPTTGKARYVKSRPILQVKTRKRPSLAHPPRTAEPSVRNRNRDTKTIDLTDKEEQGTVV